VPRRTGSAGRGSIRDDAGRPPLPAPAGNAAPGPDPAPALDAAIDEDASEPGAADSSGITQAIRNRYTFDGQGSTARDVYGSADGSLRAVELSGDSSVRLNGGDPRGVQYVELPSRLLSGLESATFEAWLTWRDSGAKWERVFDFGDPGQSSSPGAPRSKMSYLFLTTQGSARGAPCVAFLGAGADSSVVIDGSSPLARGQLVQIGVVIDRAASRMKLFVDGEIVGETRLERSLAEIADERSWLGRSLYSNDPYLHGTLHDFRIYARALSEAEIATSHRAGPDPAFLIR
jgi:hypothetical protein